MNFSSSSWRALRHVVVIAGLATAALLAAPGCNEILGLCPDDTDGAEYKACFLRTCEDGDELCKVGPVLAGAEVELLVRVRDTKATDLRVVASRDDGVDVTGAGDTQSCFTTESQAQPSGDGGNDPLGGDECTWRGRIRTAEAGFVHVSVQDQDGNEIDYSDIEVRRADRVEVAVVQSELGNDLHEKRANVVPAEQDGSYALKVMAGQVSDLFLVPTAYDAEGEALHAVADAFEFTAEPENIVSAQAVNNGSLVQTDAILFTKAVGQATVKVSTRNTDEPVSTEVRLLVRN